MKRAIYLLLLILVSASCTGKKQSDTVNSENETVAASEISLEQQLGQATDPLEKFKLLDQIAKEKTKTLSPEEFGSYFLEFKTQMESFIAEINAAEEEYLEQRYGLHHDENGNEITPPDWVNEKEKRYADIGLNARYIGEGFYEFQPADDYFTKNFNQYLPQDAKDFLQLTENDGTIVSDGGVWVTDEEFADVILRYENFIQKYPDSKLLPEVKEQYHFYQTIYLTGIDNSPRMNNSGRLLPEAKVELNRFVKAYPNSKTAELAKMVLEEKETDPYKLNMWIEEQQK